MCAAARGAKQSDVLGAPPAGGTSVKSCETDWENGDENRSPVFSYDRSLGVGKYYIGLCVPL